MANIDEAFAALNDVRSVSVNENVDFVIDSHLRVISIPTRGVILGVEGDKDVNRVTFRMSRTYKGIDMSQFQIRINYANANNELNYFKVTEITVGNDEITFVWVVGADAVAYVGNVEFVVRFIKLNGSSIIQELNTTLAAAKSLVGLSVDGEISPVQREDLLAHFYSEIDAYTETKKNEILDSIPEDYTALANEVDELKEDLENYNNSVNGYNVLNDAEYLNGKIVDYEHGWTIENAYWDTYVLNTIVVKELLISKSIVSVFHVNVAYFSRGTYVSGKHYEPEKNEIRLTIPDGCDCIKLSVNVHDDDLTGLIVTCVTDVGNAIKDNANNISSLESKTSNLLTVNKSLLDDDFYSFPKITEYEYKYAHSLENGKPKFVDSASRKTYTVSGNIDIKVIYTNEIDTTNVAIYLLTITRFVDGQYSTKTFNVNNLFLYNTSTDGTVYGIKYKINVADRSIRLIGNDETVTICITMNKDSGYVEVVTKHNPKWLMRNPNEIYVCSNDAKDYEKEYADLICDGINDEVEIMEAISKLDAYGVVILSSGTFHIQGFSRYRTGDVLCAIFSDKYLTIKGSGRANTKLYVSDATLSGQTEKVAIVNGYDTCINMNDLSFELENHNHPCICYYGANLSRGNLTNVSAKASANDSSATSNIPNEGCIAFVSYHGDDAGTITIWESLFACGFYRAFQLGAEHHILKQCTGRYNYCTFTFGEYEVKLGNAFSHPITLINCADEHQCLLPQFYKCGAMVEEDSEGHPLQEVDFISFNIERWNDWPEHQMCAKEVNAGDFCGRIEYTMNGVTSSPHEEWTATKNLKYAKFWENGSGVNFITRNMTHRLGGTTELRNTYYPNFMQEYYDTDLCKKLIYNGTNWVDLNGQVIN